MGRRLGYRMAAAMTMVLVLDLVGCGNDPVELEPDPTVLAVTVRSRADSARIEDSNVVLYQAATREAVLRGMTNSDGVVYFQNEAGDYL